MSEEKPQISKQLREFQSKIKPIKKHGENPHFKSSYAKHEDVFEYFLPILASCGLSLHQAGKDHNEYFFLNTVLENDDGEKRESLWPVCKSDLDIQKKCAAATYVSRHAAMRMLGLSAAEEDNDGNDITQDTPTNMIIPKNTATHVLSDKGLEKIPPKNYAPQSQTQLTIEALVNYKDRNMAKTAGFKFDDHSKRWLKTIDISDNRQYPFETRDV